MEWLIVFFNSDATVHVVNWLVIVLVAAVIAGAVKFFCLILHPKQGDFRQVRDANGKLLGVVNLDLEPDLGDSISACLPMAEKSRR